MNYKRGLDYIIWLCHRVSGIVIFAFLLIHLITVTLLKKESINSFPVDLKSSKFVKVGEYFLVISVLIHTLAGVRILLFELELTSPTRKTVTFAFLLLYILIALFFLHKFAFS
ncbi:MAG: hypothetical protein N2Z40_05115 [Caldimicrobium sp.]|nr:hypothetical protein [Caldimicrobium sp.]MCX7613581.1 hypothetical protein [Caldimicrobium sp.]MDW8182341.1 hypothetical protein [Caldimicrobium sp.]